MVGLGAVLIAYGMTHVGLILYVLLAGDCYKDDTVIYATYRYNDITCLLKVKLHEWVD